MDPQQINLICLVGILWYTIDMNTTDKIIVTFVTNSPRMKFSAFRNGLFLASGSNAQELGEKFARQYKTEWILNDGSKFYTERRIIAK
jgi:hypothetical protein